MKQIRTKRQAEIKVKIQVLLPSNQMARRRAGLIRLSSRFSSPTETKSLRNRSRQKLLRKVENQRKEELTQQSLHYLWPTETKLQLKLNSILQLKMWLQASILWPSQNKFHLLQTTALHTYATLKLKRLIHSSKLWLLNPIHSSTIQPHLASQTRINHQLILV